MGHLFEKAVKFMIRKQIHGVRLRVGFIYFYSFKCFDLSKTKIDLKCAGFFSPDMSYRRRNAGVVCHDGLLFVVGGDDGSTNLSNVEVSINFVALKKRLRSLSKRNSIFQIFPIVCLSLFVFFSGLRDKN